jgi:fructose/tagatose bisphosphate aldolase
LAFYVRIVTASSKKQNDIPVVILHTDYHPECTRMARKTSKNNCDERYVENNASSSSWLEEVLEANQEYFESKGKPLFSSILVNFSGEPLEENLAICRQYFEHHFVPIQLWMEIKLKSSCDNTSGQILLPPLLTLTKPKAWETYVKSDGSILCSFINVFKVSSFEWHASLHVPSTRPTKPKMI